MQWQQTVLQSEVRDVFKRIQIQVGKREFYKTGFLMGLLEGSSRRVLVRVVEPCPCSDSKSRTAATLPVISKTRMLTPNIK